MVAARPDADPRRCGMARTAEAIVTAADIAEDVDARLRRYADLDRDLLRAIGADRFPAAPIWLVDRGAA
jgi:hypothetical protein